MKGSAQHLFKVSIVGNLLTEISERSESVKKSLSVRFHCCVTESRAVATGSGHSPCTTILLSIASSSARIHDPVATARGSVTRSEEHTSELQSLTNLVCRLLLEKKNKQIY